jgi:hypothetical protein
VLLLRLPRLLKQTEGWEVRHQQETEARSSGPPSCQPGKRVQRTEGPEWEPGWATSWQQGRTTQGRVGTAHYAHEREQAVQHQHDPPGDWWGPEPPLVSGQIPPGYREPAPVDQDLGYGGRRQVEGCWKRCAVAAAGREKEVEGAPVAGEAGGGGDGEGGWGLEACQASTSSEVMFSSAYLQESEVSE